MGAIEAGGGAILDFHSASSLPASIGLPSAVFILRADTSSIYDRLEARGYEARKVRENVECEIFGVVAEEASEAFGEVGIRVEELQSNSAADLAANVAHVVAAATAASAASSSGACRRERSRAGGKSDD